MTGIISPLLLRLFAIFQQHTGFGQVFSGMVKVEYIHLNIFRQIGPVVLGPIRQANISYRRELGLYLLDFHAQHTIEGLFAVFQRTSAVDGV